MEPARPAAGTGTWRVHCLELGVLQRGRNSTYHCQCHHIQNIICFAELSKAQVSEKSPAQSFIGKTTSVVVIHTQESNLALADTMRGSLCRSPLLQEVPHNPSLLLHICVHTLCVKITMVSLLTQYPLSFLFHSLNNSYMSIEIFFMRFKQ